MRIEDRDDVQQNAEKQSRLEDAEQAPQQFVDPAQCDQVDQFLQHFTQKMNDHQDQDEDNRKSDSRQEPGVGVDDLTNKSSRQFIEPDTRPNPQDESNQCGKADDQAF
ncbi:MAG TPA: hypothetical protein PK711_01020 [Bacteroidales bacterium]|nr:hypothetical protein [Bacteroidales bacterium]HRZ20275.1 hypothetical protein [Bacteroidales bacterium]